EDYFDVPAEVCAVRPESSGLVLIYAWDEEDIAITGEGTVDGRGPEFFPGRNESPSFRGHWPKPALPRPREVQFDVAPEAEGLRLVDSRRHHDASAALRGRLVDELLEVYTAGARGEERKRGNRRRKESADFHMPYYTTFCCGSACRLQK
ncbi:MAG: hypothetical protein II840_01390, partial [Kiritimatiellae bacterium]|nr:hypothetical protein [Kiritimatiellia bacterium]